MTWLLNTQTDNKLNNINKMKSISILKHNLMRATMTLALMVTCATA